MGEKTLHIFVEGRVQGVFFRRFVKENADLLGLKGFVRNLSDGRVETVCTGSDEALDSIVEKLKAGPRLSRIDRIKFDEIFSAENFISFEVRH